MICAFLVNRILIGEVLQSVARWKKRLVSPIERHYFAKCDRIVVTGDWEEEWCRAWGLQGPFETVDLKRFFDLSRNHLRRGYGGQEERKERKGECARLTMLERMW